MLDSKIPEYRACLWRLCFSEAQYGGLELYSINIYGGGARFCLMNLMILTNQKAVSPAMQEGNTTFQDAYER